MHRLNHIAVGAGLLAALSQVPTPSPSMPVIGIGVLAALLGAMGITDRAAAGR